MVPSGLVGRAGDWSARWTAGGLQRPGAGRVPTWREGYPASEYKEQAGEPYKLLHSLQHILRLLSQS